MIILDIKTLDGVSSILSNTNNIQADLLNPQMGHSE